MVNLLPQDVKQGYMYARKSSMLARWCRLIILVLVLVGGVSAGGYIYIDQSVRHLQKTVDASKQQLATEKLDETSAVVESISGNISLISQVLSKQVLFSRLFKQIGNSMPAGTVLDKLEISSEVTGGIDISAIAKDYASATQVQINLSDPNAKIFDKIEFNSVSCAPVNTTPDPKSLSALYPCRVAMRALFTKDNPFLLISNKPTGNIAP